MRRILFLIAFTTLANTLCVHAQSPFMQSALINSCNGSCNEGNNEIIFLNTGASSVLVNSANVSITYGTTAAPTTNYTDAGLVTNPATTASLNTAAGCTPNLLVEATGTVVPPNSLILVVQNGICANSLNWPGLCSMGPIYITYSNDVNWLAAGNFVNSTGTTRHFRTSITNTLGTTNVIDYNYTLPAGFSNDGAFATWSTAGGAAASYGDNDCILSPTILPVSLISFGGFAAENFNQLNWETEREQNNDFFKISRSLDGITFETVSKIPSNYAGGKTTYSFEDPYLQTGYVYYRLSQTDYNGHEQLLDEIVIYRENKAENYLFPNPSSGIVYLSLDKKQESNLKNYSITNQNGSIIEEKTNLDLPKNDLITFDFNHLSKGFYTIQLVFEDKIEQKKFILQ